MTLRHLRRATTVCAPSIALAASLLAVGGMPAAAAEPVAETSAKRAPATTTHVAGWALLGPGERVNDGLVEVWEMSGRSLLAGRADRSSATGTFDVAVRRLPRQYVISVRGGRVGRWKMRGTMGVVVRRGKPGDKLHVTPLTTLIAARVGLHRSVPRAEREVRRLLAIPRWQDLYGDARYDARAFDGGRFVRAAQKQGGLDRYVAEIGKQVGRRRVTFRGGRRAQASFIGITPLDLARAGAGALVGQGIGWILRELGFNKDPNTAILRQMQEQLTQINQQLIKVREQLDSLSQQGAQSDFNSRVETAGFTWIGTDRDTIQRNLDWLVDNMLRCDAVDRSACSGGIPADVAPLEWCARTPGRSATAMAVCAALDRLDVTVRSRDYDEFSSRVIGGGNNDGVLTSYQKLRYAQARAGDGFLTSAYHDDVKALTENYSWITAVLATYGAEHSRAILRSDRQATLLSENAVRAIQTHARLLPRALPPRSTIDLRTNTAWSVLPNPARACGNTSTKHELLWWRADSDRIADQPACGKQLEQARADHGGVTGWAMPLAPAVETLIAPWKAAPAGRSLAEWLKARAGLPDFSVLDRAFPVPPPDLDFHNPSLVKVSGYYYGNPGTSAGIATDTCAPKAWTTGMSIRLWDAPYNLQVHGVFCTYIRTDNGAPAEECVKAFQWAVVRYDRGMPCQTPVSTYRMSKANYGTYWPSHGPLDYGHPLVHIYQRPVSGDEGWFRKP